MEQVIFNLSDLLKNFGILGGFILIYIESMIPILPLAAFIYLNVITFGNVIGFIISYIATICGCMTMFIICKKFQNKFLKNYKKNSKIINLQNKINNINFSNLVIILAIPFTPAFAINIAAGFSNISYKKYFYVLLLSKIPMTYFWVFIGKTFSESLSDVTTLIKLSILLIGTLFVSKVTNKILKF